MKTVLWAMIVALVVAIALGLAGQSRPAAERAVDLIRPVPDSWYLSLPRDPDQATAAFLARVPPVMRERGEAMSRTRYWALTARFVVGLGSLLLFLWSGAASALSAKLSRFSRHNWIRDLVFATILLIYAWIVTLPVEVLASYIRYRVFGFSDQPFFGWLQDYLVGWLGLAAFDVAGIVILMAVIRSRPRTWWVWSGLVFAVLATGYTVAAPAVIEPLVNTFTPLTDTPLKRGIETLARAAGIPATDVYTSDASRQTRRLNGHVSGGLGSTRIVIDDTALRSSAPMVLALAAHEMGHYKMNHPLKMVGFASLVAVLGFALIACPAPLCIARFVNQWDLPSPGDTGAIAIFWPLFTAWGFVADPLTNAYARVQEAQADQFSLDLSKKPDGLAEFMIHDSDIARLDPTLLDVVLFYDHPSDASRVRAAMRWRRDLLATAGAGSRR